MFYTGNRCGLRLGDGLAIVGPLIGGIVFSTLFWARRSLRMTVLAHAGANAMVVLLWVAYVFLFRQKPSWFQ